MRYVMVLACLMAPDFTQAETSLGLSGASLSFGYTQDEDGVWQVDIAGAVMDVAVTSVHGVQGGLRFVETQNGGIGAIDAHLYMQPDTQHKFGVFATLSDVDGRALRWGTLGVEGMLALGDNTIGEARAGIGYSDDGLDFVFAGAGLAHALTDNVTIEGHINLTDYDEPGLHALSYEVTARASYALGGSSWSVFGEATGSGFSGPDELASETRMGLGITLDLGRAGGVDAGSRLFETYDPVEPLIRRGLW